MKSSKWFQRIQRRYLTQLDGRLMKWAALVSVFGQNVLSRTIGCQFHFKCQSACKPTDQQQEPNSTNPEQRKSGLVTI